MPKMIVRRAIEADQRQLGAGPEYTCQERVAQKRLDHQGAAKSQVVKTYDVTIYYNEPYQRLIQMNDKPFVDKEEKKEDEKLEKLISNAKLKPAGAPKAPGKKQEKKQARRKERAFCPRRNQCLRFSHGGEEQIDGRGVYGNRSHSQKGFSSDAAPCGRTPLKFEARPGI